MKFEMSKDEATHLINLLGQLPTTSGVYPLLVQLVTQFKEQDKEVENG